MEHRTKRIIAHTFKNLLNMLLVIAALVAVFASIILLKTYYQLSEESALMVTVVPMFITGAVWLCYIKARDDVSTLEHKESLTMERLKQDFNS